MAGTYELKKTSSGQYMFNLKAGNGEVILTSEQYKSKSGAEAGIESVRKNSPIDERYERKSSTSNQPFFNLKAANHEVIGRSEMYSSTSARENGIESVKKNGPNAKVVERS
ncbi:MAG: YegP family protein [Parvibaculum sp.]